MSLNPAARELLLDSEATLRLAGAAAADAAGETVPRARDLSSSAPLATGALPELILRVEGEIDAILNRMRAVADIMNSIDRALALADRLESVHDADPTDDSDRAHIRAAIRSELFSVMTHLRFHDIAKQHFNDASILSEVEDRLALLTQAFDPRSPETAEPGRNPDRSCSIGS